jgi:hypothetical protein
LTQKHGTSTPNAPGKIVLAIDLADKVLRIGQHAIKHAALKKN